MRLEYLILAISWQLVICQSTHQSELSYIIQEELDVGFQIADVITDAALTSRYDATALSQLRFKFLSRPSFNVIMDSVSGIISVSGRLDREEICEQEERCKRRLDIAIQPMPYFMIIKISIDILDINDNSPVFQPDKISHEMIESSPLGTTFIIPAAFDPDVSINSIQKYELRSNAHSANFKLNVSKRLDGSTDVRLMLIRSLDRETRDLHQLIVVAYDGGEPSRTGTLLVDVIVGDANDNSPVFEYNSYELTIVENIPPQTTIVRVQAKDADLGKNSEVKYYFSSQTMQSSGNVFNINATSGEVIVTGVVDYEQTPIYRLMISAKDMGTDPVSADAMLIIKVEDANDNAPEIQINTLQAANTSQAEVPENVAADTFVAHVLVKDPDSGMNGRFECFLDDKLFRLKIDYDGEFQLVTRQKLDRETTVRYTVQLSCKDGGQTPLVSYKQLDIDVIDENDNQPMFEHDIYLVEVMENNAAGLILDQVSAVDSDEGSNSRLTYFIQNKTVGSYFEIDPRTGIIRTKVSLDCEQASQHKIMVAARDHGQDSKVGTCEVRVTVLDANDEAPQFSPNSYSMALDENLPAGTEVGFVSARDEDARDFNDFTFSFLPSQSPSEPFSMDPKTGRVITTQELDRETHATYHLLVAAKDSHNPSLSSTAELIIHVLDQNDNAPRWSYPPDNDVILPLSSRTTVGRSVLKLVAKDPDIGDNGDIRYTFVKAKDPEIPIEAIVGDEEDVKSPASDANISEYFSLDDKSGEVTLIKDLSEVPDNTSFLMKVMASDRGSRSMFRTRIVRFAVNKTMPASGYHLSQNEIIVIDNIVVVVALSCATGLVLVTFLTAMVCLVRRRKTGSQNRGDANYKQKYNCRIEALKALTAKETALAAGTHNGCESPCRMTNGCVTHGLLADDVVHNCADVSRLSCTGSDVSYMCSVSDPGACCRDGGRVMTCRCRSDCSRHGCCSVMDSGNSTLPSDIRHRCCDVIDDRIRPDILKCSHKNGIKTINLLDECGLYYAAVISGDRATTTGNGISASDPWIERLSPSESEHRHRAKGHVEAGFDGQSCSTVDGGFLDGSSSDGGRNSQQSVATDGRKLSPLKIQLPNCRTNVENGNAVTSVHLPPQVRPSIDALTIQHSPRGSTAPASPSSSVQSYQTVIMCSVSPNTSRVQTRLVPNGSEIGSPHQISPRNHGSQSGSPYQISPKSPTSTYKGNVSSFLGNGKVTTLEKKKNKADCLECHDMGLLNRTSVI